MQEVMVFLDLETTGLDAETDEIIEIGMLAATPEEIVRRYHTLVKPLKGLPPGITNLTGIQESDLRDAPAVTDVMDEVLAFIGDDPVVGHNISFDMSFLEKAAGRPISNPRFDTINLAQIAFPEAPSLRLEYLRRLVGAPTGRSHRAMADAEAAWQVFRESWQTILNFGRQALSDMAELIEDHESFFCRVMRSFLEQPAAVFSISTVKAELPVPSLPDKGGSGSREADRLLNFFGPTGVMAQDNPGYHFRPNQTDMMETVLEGFQTSRHMIIEGGTGTGKSLAYLVPAAYWALQEGMPVVVATHTINLQEQLWKKDIPFLVEKSGVAVRAALVKGRQNYICLRRWYEKRKTGASESLDETVFLLKLAGWLAKTESGDKAEINLVGRQTIFWNEVCSDQDLCLGAACRWFNRGCFVSRVRKSAEAADILVVNHSLLLSDLRVFNKLLPNYDHLVIDEAHRLEDSATQQMGWSLDFQQFRNRLAAQVWGFGGGRPPGILIRLKMSEAVEHVKLILEAASETEDFLPVWLGLVNGQGMDGSGASPGTSWESARVRDGMRQGEAWQFLTALLGNLVFRIEELKKILKKTAASLEGTGRREEEKEQHIPLVREIESHIIYLDDVKRWVNQFLSGDENTVFWVQRNAGTGNLLINSAPVKVGDILKDVLFEAKKSILLTSATLSVGGSFQHFAERVGLTGPETPEDGERMVTRIYASPFAFEKQSLMCVVRDLPDPARSTEEEFAEAAAGMIAKIGRLFRGRTLVLFTSHRMLRSVYYMLKNEFEAAGIMLLGHKIDGGRSRLTEEFRRAGQAVLFGASSFWEGVDIPGQALECVVVVRLPFDPPNSPLVEARTEDLVRRRQDPFISYAVPGAVIKMKQGFGRLIRSEEDQGVVVVLDRRIVDRRYGHRFLQSLPVKTHFKGDSDTVLQKISDWLRGNRQTEPLNLVRTPGDIEGFLQRQGSRKQK